MMEIIIILLVLLFIFGFSYFTIYKKTNDIKIALSFFLLYGISFIFYFIFSEGYPFVLAYLLPTSIYACIFLNYHKNVNEKIFDTEKFKKSYSFNHLEYSGLSVLIMGICVFITLLLVIFKVASYNPFRYIIFFIGMSIAIYASTIKYIKIHIFEDKCIFADEKITTINFSQYNSYEIKGRKIIFFSEDKTYKTSKIPRHVLLELEGYFSKLNIEKKAN